MNEKFESSGMKPCVLSDVAEAMLSSIPETLSGMPSMPSMPSVPSMSEIERSMQSGWTSITGSLGLANSLPEQQAAASGIAAWTAFQDAPSTSFQDAPSTAQPTPLAQPAPLLAQQQQLASSSGHADADPFAQLYSARTGSTAAPASPTAVNRIQSSSSLARSTAEQAAAATPAGSFTLPRKPATGLQSIDPLNAAREAASVPLMSMASSKQPLTPRGASQLQRLSQHSPSTSADDAQNVSMPASLEGSPSNVWSDFTTAANTSYAAEQQATASDLRKVDQPASSGLATDPWAAWAGPTTVQQSPAQQSQRPVQDQFSIQHLDANSKQASLLDL